MVRAAMQGLACQEWAGARVSARLLSNSLQFADHSAGSLPLQKIARQGYLPEQPSGTPTCIFPDQLHAHTYHSSEQSQAMPSDSVRNVACCYPHTRRKSGFSVFPLHIHVRSFRKTPHIHYTLEKLSAFSGLLHALPSTRNGEANLVEPLRPEHAG